MPPRSFEQLELPEVEEIVIQDAELRQVILELARRSAGGANKGGRYNKHDTARLRFIRDKALMGLRLGILVPEQDLKMIRLPPQDELKQRGGADWLAMEAWAEQHGKDPRSQKSGPITELEQTTLLNFVSRNLKRFIDPAGARSGAPKNTLVGESVGANSVYAAYTIAQLAEKARTGDGHLIPNAGAGVPRPGAYLRWLTSDAIDWQFPRHAKLFCALRLLDGYPVRVEGAGWHVLTLPERAHERYSAHVAALLQPHEEDYDPYAAAAADRSSAAASSSAPAAAAAAAADHDDGADAEVEPPWIPHSPVDRTTHRVSKEQHAFFRSVLEEISSGERKPYSQWGRLEVWPDDSQGWAPTTQPFGSSFTTASPPTGRPGASSTTFATGWPTLAT